MSKYHQLLKEQGEEAAKEYMRSIRAKGKPSGGLSYTSKRTRKRVAKNAARARWHKDEETDTPPASQEG